MSDLPFQRVILGLCGGIACYKAAELARQLGYSGADVRCVMTEGALSFIQPLTLQALTGNPVHTELFDVEQEAGMGHIALARFADCIIVAPATAHFIAKIAHGFADDLLTTLCLASKASIILAPAMNQHMWLAPQTVENVQRCRALHIRVLNPESGLQACGDVGPGRMLSPEAIIAALMPPVNRRRILITAGPTFEPIDPVRYIANRSSGKMGYALADCLAKQGHHVTLISGPVALSPPVGLTQIIRVSRAEEMLQAVMNCITQQDIFISAAAVSDYRVVDYSSHKLKKTEQTLQLELTQNTDILRHVSQSYPELFTVGFAAETEALTDNALKKLHRKQLAMICANPVGGQHCAFNADKSELTVITAKKRIDLPYQHKQQHAAALADLILSEYDEKDTIKNTG